MTRNTFGALMGTVAGQPVDAILAGLLPALPEKRVEFDKHQRGDAINHDLYGYDPVQGVAVVQVRHFFRRYKNGYGNVRKTYVLTGKNENGEFFRHPVGAIAIRVACRQNPDPIEVVRAAQRWMWGVTDRQLAISQRQGDVLMVPERRLPAGLVEDRGQFAVMAETHEVRSHRIVTVVGKRHLYAMTPRLRHTKGQHDSITALHHDGWHSIRVADEAPAWDFSLRLGD